MMQKKETRGDVEEVPGGRGVLEVHVLSAHNLPAKTADGFSDPCARHGQDKNSQLVVDMPPEVGQVAQENKAKFVIIFDQIDKLFFSLVSLFASQALVLFG